MVTLPAVHWSSRYRPGAKPGVEVVALGDEPVEQFEGLVFEVTVIADDLRAAQLLEHGASLRVVAAVRVVSGVDEVEIADMGFDGRPVVTSLQYGFVLGVGLGAVPG